MTSDDAESPFLDIDGVPPSGPDGRARGRTARNRRVVALAAVAAAVLAAVVAVVVVAWSQRTDPRISWREPPRPAPQVALATSASPAAIPAVTLTAVGDVIMGSAPQALPPRSGAGFFDRVRPSLPADLVMGNLEETLTPDTGVTKCAGAPAAASPGSSATPGSRATASPRATANSGGSCFQFHLPPSYAGVLRDAGFGLVNLANNHAMDQGAAGLRNTRAALAAVGLRDTGGPGEITGYQAAGLRIAVIGAAPYPWAQSLLDIDGTAALVRQAATQADLVLVQMHAGAEGRDRTHVRPGMETFIGEQRGDPYRFAHAMIDAGADLVVGHGPHVLRGMEFYKGRLIAYSLGNFAGYRVLNTAGDSGAGGVLRVTLRKDGTWVSGTLASTRMVDGGIPAPDPTRRAIALVSAMSAQDFGAAGARISGAGAIEPVPAA